MLETLDDGSHGGKEPVRGVQNLKNHHLFQIVFLVLNQKTIQSLFIYNVEKQQQLVKRTQRLFTGKQTFFKNYFGFMTVQLEANQEVMRLAVMFTQKALHMVVVAVSARCISRSSTDHVITLKQPSVSSGPRVRCLKVN